jgi:simple sugar transport system permease protein
MNFDLGLLLVAVFGGLIRVGTPYLYVSLGECVTERAGRVNLGLEGTLFMGAITGYAVSFETSRLLPPEVAPWLSPWLGVLAAGLVGLPLGAMHAILCNLPRVNFVALGIAMMYFGKGLAKFLGKRYIQPIAPKLDDVDFGWWATTEQVHFAFRINQLFLIGLVLTPLLAWMLKSTRWGMILRLAGESEEAAAAMGYSVNIIRIGATAFGGFMAGVAGSYLSLYYPGSWNEQISTGQGLMAVALVIFARWDPIRCLLAALLFGGAGSLGLALQGQNLTSSSTAYLWNSAPYVLTLVIMMITSSRSRAMAGAPGVLTGAR